MEGMSLDFANFFQSFWNDIINIFLIIVSFLISKKAILAAFYYFLGINKTLFKIGHKVVAKKRDGQDTTTFIWENHTEFNKFLEASYQAKQEEFYYFLKFLIQEKILKQEEVLSLPLYSIFSTYQGLQSFTEKQKLAQQLKKKYGS